MQYVRNLLAFNPIQVRRIPESDKRGLEHPINRLKAESMQRHHAEKTRARRQSPDKEYLLGRERRGKRGTVRVVKVQPRWINTHLETRYLVAIIDNDNGQVIQRKWRHYQQVLRMLQI